MQTILKKLAKLNEISTLDTLHLEIFADGSGCLMTADDKLLAEFNNPTELDCTLSNYIVLFGFYNHNGVVEQ